MSQRWMHAAAKEKTGRKTKQKTEMEKKPVCQLPFQEGALLTHLLGGRFVHALSHAGQAHQVGKHMRFIMDTLGRLDDTEV